MAGTKGASVWRLAVGAEAHGERLDRFLAGPVGSRAQAQRLIAAGRVRLGGAPTAPSRRVEAGQMVEVDDAGAPSIDPGHAGPAHIDVRIAWEDAHLLVVDKPAGLVVHPAPGHRTHTLAQALAGRAAGGAEPARAGIVHRLDRDTSGLLVVARSDAVHRALQRALAARHVQRTYLALVEGRPPARNGTIDAPLGRDRRARRLVSVDTDDPREARTHFSLAEALPAHTLLEISLETGRTHQIRAHMRAIGHPVAGDPTYGTAGQLGLERQFLHSTRLRFEHPVTGAGIDVGSPLPSDLTRALERARLESAGS